MHASSMCSYVCVSTYLHLCVCVCLSVSLYMSVYVCVRVCQVCPQVTLSHKTETRPRRWTLKTEMRRSKKHIETAVSQFKNTYWWSLSLDTLFLAGQIHYFLCDISASLMHCMDVHKTNVTRPRRYIKTEMRPRRWTLRTETRPRRSIFPNSRDRDETETETLNLQDETRRSKKRLETASRPRRSRLRLHPWCVYM